jgi:hypothetical protein
MKTLRMKRRDFLKQATILGSTSTLLATQIASSAPATHPPDNSRELYELRAYRLKDGAPHELLDEYIEKALIPALNRAGSAPIGVLKEMEQPKDGPAIWVLIPHQSAQAFAIAATRIYEDPQYQKSAMAYFRVGKAEPAFQRIDSWLLLAFTGMPRLEMPALARNKKKHIFEMRTYESYSESKALKKIEMFNSGEIEVMREVGLSPVFYGQALVGKDLPHLTYMLCGETREAHKEHFTSFTKHPTWLKLKDDPQFADTVSKITSRFLEPLPYSQI